MSQLSYHISNHAAKNSIFLHLYFVLYTQCFLFKIKLLLFNQFSFFYSPLRPNVLLYKHKQCYLQPLRKNYVTKFIVFKAFLTFLRSYLFVSFFTFMTVSYNSLNFFDYFFLFWIISYFPCQFSFNGHFLLFWSFLIFLLFTTVHIISFLRILIF